MQRNLIITLLFSIIIALFAILNAAAIPVNLIFTKVDVSAALVILISASIGAVIVYSLDMIAKMKSRKKIKELEKNNTALTSEVTELKAALEEQKRLVNHVSASSQVSHEPKEEVEVSHVSES